MARDSTLSHIVKHAGFDTFGTAINYILMFGTSVIITRTIGAELFGKYSLSNSIFLILGVFAVFGLNTGVVRLTSKYNARGDSASVKGTLVSGMLLSGAFGSALMIIVIAISPLLASKVFKNVEGISWVLRLHIIALPFYAIMLVVNGYAQGFKTLKYSVIVEFLARPTVRLGLVVLLFTLGLRLKGVLYATVISYVCAAILALLFAIRVSKFPFRTTSARLVTSELFFYSVPLVLARFMNVIIARSNTILVGYFKEPTSTGLFGAAVTLAAFIPMSLHSFSRIFAPIVSDLWEKQRLDELRDTFKAVSKWVLSIGLPVFMLFLLFPSGLLEVFGKEFGKADATLRLLAAGQIINVLVGPVGYVLTMTGRQKLNLLNSIILAGVNVALNIIMIPRWGIIGAGLATAISLAAINILKVIQVKVIYGFTPLRKDIYKPLVAGGLAGVIIYLVSQKVRWESLQATLGLCIAFLCLYFGLLYALGLKEEKEVILNILRRKR